MHVFSSSCRIHASHIGDLFFAGPKHSVGPLRCHTGFKVYVLTSWCKWVRYPAPRPSPQPLHRRAICAAKSGNSAPRTKHLENQLDLFLHGQAECQTTQGFLAHNVFLHHFIFYFRFFFLSRAESCPNLISYKIYYNYLFYIISTHFSRIHRFFFWCFPIKMFLFSVKKVDN